jgi:hypothetical protein
MLCWCGPPPEKGPCHPDWGPGCGDPGARAAPIESDEAGMCPIRAATKRVTLTIREYEITSKGVVIIGERLTDYQGLIIGIPQHLNRSANHEERLRKPKAKPKS